MASNKTKCKFILHALGIFGGRVAKVRKPVWPGSTWGLLEVRYFFTSLDALLSSEFVGASLLFGCLRNSRSITGNVRVLITLSCCSTSMETISLKPSLVSSWMQRCDCSMQGENEQNLPPENEMVNIKKIQTISDYFRTGLSTDMLCYLLFFSTSQHRYRKYRLFHRTIEVPIPLMTNLLGRPVSLLSWPHQVSKAGSFNVTHGEMAAQLTG